jgi:hypothetical protein
MKLIGAGLPRTAATTQMFALERLGAGPCYHMCDLLVDLEAGLPLWERVEQGTPEWERILGGCVFDRRGAIGPLLPGADGLLPRGQGLDQRPTRRAAQLSLYGPCRAASAACPGPRKGVNSM